jgi:predicted CXXCH cytochrome family protein
VRRTLLPVLAAILLLASPLHAQDSTTVLSNDALVSSCKQITLTAVLSGDADNDGHTTVEYNTTPTWPGTTACAAVTGSPPRQCLVTGLSPGSTYYVRITHTDPDGVFGPTPEVLGPTAVPACGADEVAPMLLGRSPAVDAIIGGTDRAKIQVYDAVDPNPGVEWSVDGGSFSPTVINSNYDCGTGCAIHEFDVDTTALSNARHYVTIRATDDAGNVGVLAWPFIVHNVGSSPGGSGTLLRRTSGSQLCYDCHSLSSHTSQSTSSKYGNWAFDCLVCHAAHNTTSIYVIRDQIRTPSSGVKSVVFQQDDRAGGTNPQYSFLGDFSAPGNAPYDDGICEVCHTKTNHYRNDNSGGDHTHNVNTRCANCHDHAQGFRGVGGTGPAHLTHTTAENGPKMTCSVGDLGCHGAQSPPAMADGGSLASTGVCDTCHSAGGSYNGVDSVGASVGAKDNWPGGVYAGGALQAGKEKWCIGCHDEAPSVVNGETASNKAGDDTTYGYYVTGHGRSGNYPRMSWQDSLATGNTGAGESCVACHDHTVLHISSSSSSTRLRTGFENDQANSNCSKCHPPGTTATANPQFYTDSAGYEASAHGGMLCTDCHSLHGESGSYAAMTLGNQEALCYQCHTEGMVQNDALANNRPGGYVSADDIQEAFAKSEKHNLGTSFSVSGKDYTLECVSCHNVHLINGRYWDAPDGDRSPVTRFPGNTDAFPVTQVWGDQAGEKMDDFAARAAGSGGWYYSKARGGVISFDQSAVYEPPKEGSGYDREFDGAVLPDYTTFCLDCHTHRMSDANPPVNWGQGIGCTGNSVDPPNQRIECGAQHGLNSANRPSFWGDTGLYGSSGNPDPIFSEPGVTRGRGAGHFMRWPYDSAHRNSGINFVMSCTDCHEAHGSNRGGIIRERFNVNDNGDCGTGGNTNPDGENCADGGNWNSFCNVCHYYYGGQHAGMSCGNASCHEVNSIHRIIHNTSSGSTYLWNEPSRPAITPEIATVEGTVGSSVLTVTFTAGVWTNRDLTGALVAEDFLFVDVNGDNPRTILGVTHAPGTSTVALTMSAPLILADFSADTLATRGMAAWDSDGDPAGPWPVAIGYSSSAPLITSVEGFTGGDDLYVTFAEPAYTTTGRTGPLVPGDFILTDTNGDNARTISAVTHTAGTRSAIVTMDAPLVSADPGADLLAAAANEVFNPIDFAYSPFGVTITAMTAPTIVSVTSFAGSDKLYVGFSEAAFTGIGQVGALVPGDFVLTDTNGDNPRSITGVSHAAGGMGAVLTLDSPQISADFTFDTLQAASGEIFTTRDHAYPTTAVAIEERVTPAILWAVAFAGDDKIYVRFDKRAYTSTGGLGDLVPTDFVLTDTNGDNPKTITAVTHTAPNDSAILTLSATFIPADLGADTLAAAASEIFDDVDNPFSTSPIALFAIAPPEILTAEGFTGGTALRVTFADYPYTNTGQSGVLIPGDFTLTDTGGDNPRSISGVMHALGATEAILTMDASLLAADLGSDTLAAGSSAIFNDIDYPFDAAPVTITAQPAPAITKAEGAIGFDKVLVSFNQGVYTDPGRSGALAPSDFVLVDSDDSRSIAGVQHVAGQANAILTLSAPLDPNDDLLVDTLAAASSAVFTSIDNAATTTPVALTGNGCPTWGAEFQLNEPPYSASTTDDSGLLVGTVGNPPLAFPVPSDGSFHGEEGEGTTINIDNNLKCLVNSRSFTVEARVKPMAVDLDWEASNGDGIDDNLARNTTFNRIFERKNTLLVTILHTWYRRDEVPERAQKASLEIKYRTSARHSCPHPRWPNDSYIGNDVWMHQVSSDIDLYPLVNDHWYRVRVVFNSDKPNIPVDIFLDDQGTDGVAEPSAGAGELWSGFRNVAKPNPEDSSSCKWGALPGEELGILDRSSHIGANWNTGAQLFEGEIDWVTWNPLADYSGVADPPN